MLPSLSSLQSQCPRMNSQRRCATRLAASNLGGIGATISSSPLRPLLSARMIRTQLPWGSPSRPKDNARRADRPCGCTPLETSLGHPSLHLGSPTRQSASSQVRRSENNSRAHYQRDSVREPPRLPPGDPRDVQERPPTLLKPSGDVVRLGHDGGSLGTPPAQPWPFLSLEHAQAVSKLISPRSPLRASLPAALPSRTSSSTAGLPTTLNQRLTRTPGVISNASCF